MLIRGMLLLGLAIPFVGMGDVASQQFVVDTHYGISVVANEAVEHRNDAESAIFVVMTKCQIVDQNENGVSDEWERRYGLLDEGVDLMVDSDGDGLTNVQEYNAGTNPLVVDALNSVDWASRCGVVDTRYFQQPFEDVECICAPVDCFIRVPFECDTGGLYYDWDGDGIPNWWEKRFARDGSKTGLDAADDDDKDGFDNYGEFVAYTDPMDAESKFVIRLAPFRVEPMRVQQTPLKLMAFSASTNDAEVPQFKLVWQSVKGRTYGVFSCSDLANGWDSSPAATIDGTGEEIEYVPSVGSAAMFFKVSVKLSENNQERGD